ncbi:MAG TPA: NADH-quinone oxidoreductase subunit A [Dermatophilaceae bacterium]|nr:NADH-quinone oxidoreductase subunit A [Dermatophilaceae bacterium]
MSDFNFYTPVLLLVGLGAAFAVLSVGTSLVVGPKRYNRAKMEAYECGIQPTPRAEGGGRIPIKYFITAMLFIIFDIESVFLYPFAVAFDQLGLFALIEMVLFVLTVFVAYAYVWRRGGLEWD